MTRAEANRSTSGVRGRWRLIGLTTLLLCGVACYRSGPPDVPEFRKPTSRAVAHVSPEAVKEEPQGTGVAMASEEVHVEEVVAPPPPAAPVAVAAPVAEAPPPAAGAPTIVGTWRMVSMVHEGMDGDGMPPGAEMRLTFGADGTLTMRMSMPGMSEPMSMSGSYTISGNQITMTMDMEPEPKTGTFTVDATTLTINIEGGTLTLSRE